MVSGLSNVIKIPFKEVLYPTPLLKAITQAGIVLAIYGALNGYFLKVVTAIIVLYFITRWFFTYRFTVAIYFALVYQWFQVSIKVFYGLFNGATFESLTQYPEHINSAFYYSAFGLLALAYGIQSQLKTINYNQADFENELDQFCPRKVLIAYIAFSIGLNLLFTLRFTVPGLFQAIALFNNFKWSLLFVFYFVVQHNKKYITAFWLIVGIEFFASFISFFADFKSFIFFILIPYLSYNQVTTSKMRTLALSSVGIFILAFIWTGVKSDYRQFLNQGSRSQAVLVEKDVASRYLFDAVRDFDIAKQNNTMKALIDRISYIDYFSACMAYVPIFLPHENGKILKQSVFHILMPRIFFPNKGAIDDSDHLNKYTGLYFANASKGVSFSLGYVGDFYIDFGLPAMLIPIFLFGILIGFILLNIYKTSASPFWGAALLTASFNVLYKLENSQIKFIGNLIWFWIVFYLIAEYVLPQLNQFLKK
jgi:hypothetical protein